MSLFRGSIGLLLLAFSLLASTESAGDDERIIGGQEVMPNSIKCQASLQMYNARTNKTQHFCGGTLVDKQWVVSAAHCLWRRLWKPALITNCRVVLGEHNLETTEGFEQEFSVSNILYNRFNSHTFDNDIVMIKLNRPAILNAKVQPIQLPSGENDEPVHNELCSVSGWGVTKFSSRKLSDKLRAVDVLVNKKNCIFARAGWLTPNMICAGFTRGGKDSCQGDSGGPLVCRGKLKGLVSWGVGCALPWYPGVYTNVCKYTNWIDNVIKTG